MSKYLFILLSALGLLACESKDELKLKQYYIDGQALYKTHCANCHQIDGKGLAGLYPPIAGSDFLKNNKNLIICAMRNGLHDTIVVNGKKYHQPMPANKQLHAIDVAEITTFIYNEWGGEKIITDVKATKKILDACNQP
ncbi:c-type cytochrome [Flectobacillus major]|jgi:mono/diheme cytochrome c family protein|uniref:c-type cytochrome n=1 Tax=Flectobacillus major TaxID=103 RepID=UPI000427B66A|nr:cytochrome c [Flectobacillus major]